MQIGFWWNRLDKGIAVLIAVSAGVLYFYENIVYTRHLKWLPNTGMRQVASLQTENGFYYSYYRELIHAETFGDGLKDIIWDKRSEYPEVLNAIRRFNIFQEIFLAYVYRTLWTFGFRWDAFEFFRHNVFLLNGFGHVALAMLASEVSGNSFAGILFYIYAFLSRFETSRLGSYPSMNLREQYGIPLLWMQTLCIWYLLQGHSYKSPNVNGRRWKLWCCFTATTFLFIIVWQFSPFLLLLQAAALYFVYLVCGYRGLRPVIVGIINVYIACTAAAIAAHFGSPYLVTSPFLYELVGLKVATSLISRRCASEAPSGRGFCRGIVAWLWRRIVDVVEGLIAVAVFGLVMKAMAPFATADTHVYEILCTKSKDVNEWLPKRFRLPADRLPECAEPSFNAQLYLIMGVFKTLEESSWNLYMKSTSGPASGVACLLIFARCLVRCFGHCVQRAPPVTDDCQATQTDQSESSVTSSTKETQGLRKRKAGDKEVAEKTGKKGSDLGQQSRSSKDKPSTHAPSQGLSHDAQSSEEAAMLFFCIQYALFFGLGFLVNRLRVAFGPPMMVMAACVFGRRTFPLQGLLVSRSIRFPIICGLLFLFGLQTSTVWSKMPCTGDNEGICSQLDEKKGSDGDLVDLMSWVNEGLPSRTPVLCSMNLAGTMRAFTNVSLIVHPQFESENLRKRVQLAYELYHCGSEESFAATMRKLHAKVAIFEYYRCFFTPYNLDDRRKNCNERRHAQEDLLCVKLHARSRFFKLLFMNGGYGVVQLRDEPLPPETQEKTPAVINSLLEKRSTWKEYVEECARSQPMCGARLAEAASVWHNTLKREKAALTLRHLANDRFPDDGYVAYFVGRHLDYEAEKPERAGHYYEKAASILPNNFGIVREYLMWLDVVAKDVDKSRKLLEARKGKPGKKREAGSPMPFLEMDSTGSYEILCEAGVAAMQQGMKKWGRAMWDKSMRMVPLQKCIQNNWQFIHPDTKYEDVYTLKAKVWHYIKTGQLHELNPHQGPGVRYLGGVNFTLVPPKL